MPEGGGGDSRVVLGSARFGMERRSVDGSPSNRWRMYLGGNNGKIDEPTPELLTAEEVAAFLRLHPDRVYRLIREHRLPAVHLGRTVRVSKHVLMEWLEAGGTVTGDKTSSIVSKEARA